MKYTTTPDYPGETIGNVLGVVTGNVVQSKHVGRDIMANLKSIIGGEIKGYTEMISEARLIALNRMLNEAEQIGADAVINVKFSTSMIQVGTSEMLAYGTAVKLEQS